MDTVKLTKGERDFLTAIRHFPGRSFHRTVIERCERKGLAFFIGGTPRLIGRNSYSAVHFALTQEGLEAVAS